MTDDRGSFVVGSLTDIEKEHIGVCAAVANMMCDSISNQCHRLQLMPDEDAETEFDRLKTENELNESLVAAEEAGFLDIWAEDENGQLIEDSMLALKQAKGLHFLEDEPDEKGPWLKLSHPKGYDLVKKAWPDGEWPYLS